MPPELAPDLREEELWARVAAGRGLSKIDPGA